MNLPATNQRPSHSVEDFNYPGPVISFYKSSWNLTEDGVCYFKQDLVFCFRIVGGSCEGLERLQRRVSVTVHDSQVNLRTVHSERSGCCVESNCKQEGLCEDQLNH